MNTKFAAGLATVFLLILVPLFSVPVRGAEGGVRIDRTGTFSSMRWHAEAGDVVGVEIRIVLTGKDTYQGTIQIAEGAPGPLILIAPEFDGNRLTFDFQPPHGPQVTFRGTISNKGVQGTLAYKGGSTVSVDTPRGCSYWDEC